MGADPESPALNGWYQSPKLKNLFVVDGSAFVSGGSQNPTLTILAVARRASDFLWEQMRTGAIRQDSSDEPVTRLEPPPRPSSSSEPRAFFRPEH